MTDGTVPKERTLLATSMNPKRPSSFSVPTDMKVTGILDAMPTVYCVLRF